MSKIIAVDFETHYCTKTGYGIKELGVAAYVRHERFNPYLISVSDGEQSWSGQPCNFNFDALDGATLLAHNAGFDSLVLAEMERRGLAPKVNFKEWHCTANLSVYCCGRRSLAQAAEFLLGVSPDKSVRDKADGKNWADLTKEDGGAAMLAYARADALLCHQLWTKYSHFWPEHERRLSQLNIRMCHRGCQIDVENLDNQRKLAHMALKQAESALPWVAEGKPPTSPRAVCEACRKEGIPGPPVKSHAPPDGGEAAYDAWEATYSPRFKWVSAYTSYRVINKYLTQLETIKTRLSEEGVLSYDILYGGAHTLRFSGGGGLNMQNLRKDPLEIDSEGWLITDGRPAAHSLNVRSLFVARPGRKLISSDLSAIEPRVLCYLAGDTDTLEGIKKGRSIYQVHAENSMSWTGGDLKTENKKLYSLAKCRVLGLGYQMGWVKFIATAALMGLDVTVDDPAEVQDIDRAGTPMFNADGTPKMVSGHGETARRMVKEFRASNSKIVALWAMLDAAFKNSVGSTFELTLPSGRVMRYPNVREEWTRVLDEETGKYRNKRAVKADVVKSGRVMRDSFYSGILTENLVQATSRDLFTEALLELDAMPGVKILFHIHDEVLLECDPDITCEQITKVMSRTPLWAPGLPVAAETYETPFYTK